MSPCPPLTVGLKPTTQASEREQFSFWAERRSDFLHATSPEKHYLPTPSSHTDHDAVNWPFQTRWSVFGPLAFLIVVSLVIRWTDTDRSLARIFFNGEAGHWPFERTEPWRWVYRKGPIPAVAFGIGAAVIAVFGRWILPVASWRRSRSLNRACLFLALLLVLGPGLTINVGLKQLWGRPRPIHCREFGGDLDFVPVGSVAPKHLTNSSFPSGHASVAFYLMAPGFVVSRRRPRLAAGLFCAGALYGLAMGTIRIVQGAHFLTDVLWSGAIVYFMGVLLAKLILTNQMSEFTTKPESNLG